MAVKSTRSSFFGSPRIQLFLLVILSFLFNTPLYEIYCEDSRDAFYNTAVILDLTARNSQGKGELTALTHSLDIFNLHYTVTQDLKAALRSPIIYTAGELRNTTLSGDEIQHLYSYVESGGVLFSSAVIGNRYLSLFGIKQPVSAQNRYQISFLDNAEEPALQYLNRPEEKKIRLGDKKLFSKIIWTHAFPVNEATSLAETEDGMSVFSVNEYGEGLAYCLGVSLTEAILLPQIGKDFEAQKTWANGYEPGADVFLLILKALYEKNSRLTVYIGNIPYGKDTALILSHDVDARTSFPNAVLYAELEKKYHVRGTYFVTTKIVKDSMDTDYYNPQNVAFLKKVQELGGDIESHSVNHSIQFNLFETGSPNVNRKNYQPLESPSIFGELVVSKEILDTDLPAQNTVAFRAGNLKFPESLIDIEEKSGYLFDSSCSANDILCNYAYRAFKNQNPTFEESSVIEIPLIFDDSQDLLNKNNQDALLSNWLDIIQANADNEAVSVLLLHTAEAGFKLETEEKLLKSVMNKNYWIGDVTTYGKFWKERAEIKYSVSLKGQTLVIQLKTREISPLFSFTAVKSKDFNKIEIVNNDNSKLSFTQEEKQGKWILHLKEN
jgi:peptidoglycan/xylan/chitin deacetylase (PgdA/CDA1 family)